LDIRFGGLSGVIFHLQSQFFCERTLKSLTYVAPFPAPLAYTGLGLLLIMNRMVSSRSVEWAQWLIALSAGGFAGNFVLFLTDHAVNGFYRPEEWIPVISAAFATAFLTVPFLVPVTGSYLRLCAVVIAIQILVGIAGFFFPVAASLAIADVYRSLGGAFEKLINGAPPMAPLLFPNLSLLALYALWAYSRFLPETGADTAVRTQLQAEGESNRRRLRIKGGHLAPYRPGSGLLSPSHLARKVVECRSRFRSAFVQKGRTHRREGRTRATVTIEGAEVRVLHRCRHKTLSPRHNRQQ